MKQVKYVPIRKQGEYEAGFKESIKAILWHLKDKVEYCIYDILDCVKEEYDPFALLHDQQHAHMLFHASFDDIEDIEVKRMGGRYLEIEMRSGRGGSQILEIEGFKGAYRDERGYVWLVGVNRVILVYPMIPRVKKSLLRMIGESILQSTERR